MLERNRPLPNARDNNSEGEKRVNKLVILPMLVTLANAFVGLMALAQMVKALQLQSLEPLKFASWLILLGLVLDALDGKIARMTETQSLLGIQLDSLCDALTFGVAPGFLMYASVLLLRDLHGPYPILERISFPIATLYVIAVIVRLARFNVEKDLDPDRPKDFAGLPSPAGAGLMATGFIMAIQTAELLHGSSTSVDMMVAQFPLHSFLLASPAIMLVIAVLNVSRITYPHFLDRVLGRATPFWWGFLAIVILFVVSIEPELTLFPLFLAYVLAGPVTAVTISLGLRESPSPSREAEFEETPAKKS